MTGIQNIKLFGSLINCDLRFICNLVLGTWNFKFYYWGFNRL